MANHVEDFGQTLMPLDYFRQFMAWNPYHFWQMTYTDHVPEGYSHVLAHNRWQNEAQRGPGRYDIIKAILQAEEDIADVNEWYSWPAPKYIESERVRLTKPNRFTYSRTPYMLMTEFWRVQSVGKQTWTLIEADVDLAYAGHDVTCDVTVGSDTVASEVVVCYKDTTIPIRPISVSIAGTTASITIKRWLCGDPDLWDIGMWESGDLIDATDTDNLISQVDVYRVWIDTSDQITIIWEPDKSETCSDTALCAGNSNTACASDKNYKIGVVGWQVGDYDADEEQFAAVSWPVTRFPDLAEINYVSGYPSGDDRYMDRRMQTIVTKLAAGHLADYVYDASSKPENLYHWMDDMAEPVSAEVGARNIPLSNLDNPFGTKRGQIDAWKAMKKFVGR